MVAGLLWMVIFYKDFKKEKNSKNRINLFIAIITFVCGLYHLFYLK